MDRRVAAARHIMLSHENFEGQVVFVAGSSRGIGRAIAEAFIAQGARVILTGRDNNSLQTTFEEIAGTNNPENLLALCGDLTDPVAISSNFARSAAHFGKIDHLIANVGSGGGESGFAPSEKEWQRLFEQNFFASVRLTQSALPYLFANSDGGSILFVASIVGLEASSAPLPYSAAKAALLNYSKNLARQLGRRKIRINTIAPGNIYFPGGTWHKKLTEKRHSVESMLQVEVPLQRFGTPEEVASLAVYLCSSGARFCTGGCYVVDGGQTRNI